MGYRKISKNTYGKPFGNSIILFDINTKIISQKFKGLNDQILTYSSRKYESTLENTLEGVIEFIAFYENWYTKHGLSCGEPIPFLTKEEYFESIL